MAVWPASDAPRVLELYRSLAEEAPAELTLGMVLRPAPPAPWLPTELHGKPIVAILACYSGSPEEGERLVAPIKLFGKPVGDVLVRRPYADAIPARLGPTEGPAVLLEKNTSRIEPELCANIVRHGERIGSPHSVF